jgi:hypothetical protein
MSIKTNLFIDLAIFVGFLVAYEPALTGDSIHEWFGLAFASALMIHVLLHWDWAVKVAAQFFRKLFHTSRLSFLLNTGLLVCFITILLSGLMISRSILPVLGIQVANNPSWRFLHSFSADLALLLVGLHVALHWKWILHGCKRYLFTPLKQRFQPRPALAGPQKTEQVL